MDALDRALLGDLSARCRVSFTELAKKHGISVNAVKKRVQSLVDSRVILAFDVQLRLEAVGASFALVTLTLKDGWTRDQLMELGKHPLINAIKAGFGSEAFAIVLYRNNEELTGVMDAIRSSGLVASAELYPLLSPPVSRSELPSEGLDALRQVDWRILKHLRLNGRMPIGKLAKLAKTSVPTARKRLEFMRSKGLIYETVIVNPGAVSKGLVALVSVSLASINNETQYLIDRKLAGAMPESYWLSWRVADRPLLFLIFEAESTKDLMTIQERLKELVPVLTVSWRIVAGLWEYFLDFRDEIMEEHLRTSMRG